MADQQQRIHAVVRGRVQGVSFRYYTAQAATQLGLTGWVRNLPDRTVEVCAEGGPAQLRTLVKFLHEGSPSARVTHVAVEWLPAENAFSGFKIRTRMN